MPRVVARTGVPLAWDQDSVTVAPVADGAEPRQGTAAPDANQASATVKAALSRLALSRLQHPQVLSRLHLLLVLRPPFSVLTARMCRTK
jgi:hypothetical protein